MIKHPLYVIAVIFTVAFIAIPFSASGQTSGTLESTRGVALVIGNAAYTKTKPLKNPVNDAVDIGKAMEGLGWDVLSYTDASLATMKGAVREFAGRLKGKKAGFFYYAGHGIQVDGVNYLVPVDADIKLRTEAQDNTMAADFILRAMDEMNVPLKIVVLDACRDNPFEATRGGGTSRGLAVLGKAPTGTVIVYATSPNDVSDDGKGRNGVFTEAFLPNLGTPGLEFKEIFDKTGELVRTRTNGTQNPWMNSSYYGKLYLISPDEAERSAGARLDAVNNELALLEKARAERAKALAAAKDQAERDRINLESKKASALEAAKKEEAVALERAKILAATRAAEEERNRTTAGNRAREAEIQLASLKKQAEDRRLTMDSTSSSSDEISAFYYRLLNYQKAIEEVRARFDDSLQLGLAEVKAAHELRLKDVEKYAKDPWENEREFKERKEEAVGLAERDYEREVEGLRAGYAVSSQNESAGLQKALTTFESNLQGKTWTIPASKIKLYRSNFDEDKKNWTFTVEGLDPVFNINFPYTIMYKTRDELAKQYTALDNAWEANALEARVTTGLRKFRGTGDWEGYIIEISLVNLGVQDAVLGTVVVNAFSYVPPKPNFIPGRLVVQGIPVLGTLRVGKTSTKANEAEKGVLSFTDVPSLEEVQISWDVPAGVSLDMKDQNLTLGEGEIRMLNFPTGTLAIPWLPKDVRLYVGTNASTELILKTEDRVAGSFVFLTGSYPVHVKGSLNYQATVTIRAGIRTELPGYRDNAIKQVAESRTRAVKQIANIEPRKTFSLISLGTGAAGSILSGIAYTQGMAAQSAYKSANSSDALLAARTSAEQWSVVFAAGAGLGGIGLALAPLLWPWNNPQSRLERSIADLDSALSILKEQESSK